MAINITRTVGLAAEIGSTAGRHVVVGRAPATAIEEIRAERGGNVLRDVSGRKGRGENEMRRKGRRESGRDRGESSVCLLFDRDM